MSCLSIPHRQPDFTKVPAGTRRTCDSLNAMQFQPPDSARFSPEIPPIPAPDSPPSEKNIGRHWATLGDIGGHMSPLNAKTRGFRFERQRSRTAAMSASQTCKIWDHLSHEPGELCAVKNVETLRPVREAALGNGNDAIETKSSHNRLLKVRRLKSRNTTLSSTRVIRKDPYLIFL